MAALETCEALPEIPNYTPFGQMDIRLVPACIGWWFGQLSDTAECKGWIKFKKDRPFDLLSILLIADAFPPAVPSSQGMAAWVPTLEFSVNVRNIPTTDWLKGIFRTRFITCITCPKICNFYCRVNHPCNRLTDQYYKLNL